MIQTGLRDGGGMFRYTRESSDVYRCLLSAKAMQLLGTKGVFGLRLDSEPDPCEALLGIMTYQGARLLATDALGQLFGDRGPKSDLGHDAVDLVEARVLVFDSAECLRERYGLSSSSLSGSLRDLAVTLRRDPNTIVRALMGAADMIDGLEAIRSRAQEDIHDL